MPCGPLRPPTHTWAIFRSENIINQIHHLPNQFTSSFLSDINSINVLSSETLDGVPHVLSVLCPDHTCGLGSGQVPRTQPDEPSISAALSLPQVPDPSQNNDGHTTGYMGAPIICNLTDNNHPVNLYIASANLRCSHPALIHASDLPVRGTMPCNLLPGASTIADCSAQKNKNNKKR